MTTVSKSSRRRMTAANQFKYQLWVASNAAKLNGLTLEAVLAMSEKAMGFEVSESNFTFAKTATQSKIHLRRSVKPKVAASRDDHKRDRISYVAAEMVALMARLGEKPSSRLTAIATRRKVA